ncbi:MAG: hypothetical protein PHD06_04380 [Bacteroidales bacterium]|nr:hypothetical protein [Bacteroidales bacterium]MDY0197766.1 hypothetical protein [Tenuifilaceae bacterium]
MKRLFTFLALGAFFIMLASCSSGKAESEQATSIQPKNTHILIAPLSIFEHSCT